VVDIFDEVDEELRAERMRELGKKYGGLIFAGCLAVIAAALFIFQLVRSKILTTTTSSV